ncbi:zinc finger BED domain-containing protein RICESLEEPER 2-like [Iris pallida]|uniref:Zinc finger BED domain-containing protein RICESLEEPER 2-like n=1 Tax=Iris pallida TaxID=29817 RepID=A0AAX6H625_IRIPA|nr:zinc finger BED domain-containing protein RICESLEEPER 2-like [Iris pallida]
MRTDWFNLQRLHDYCTAFRFMTKTIGHWSISSRDSGFSLQRNSGSTVPGTSNLLPPKFYQ